MGEVRPVTTEPTTPLAVPTTRAGQAHVAFWLAGRTHPPSTQRLGEFIEHVRATEAEARNATGLQEAADATATKLEHWGDQFFPRGGWMTHWAISFRALASELRAALAAAPPEPRWIADYSDGSAVGNPERPPEPRWPSRDELAKALDEALRALNSGDMRDWEAYPSNVKRARAILAALREGAERP